MMAAALLRLVALAAPPDPATVEQVAFAEAGACLRGERWQADARHVPVSTANLGLPPGKVAARIADAPASVVAYQDDGSGQVIECGVLVLSPLPSGAAERFAAAVEARPGYRPASPSLWRWPGPAAVRTRYWGFAGAPGLYGAMLREGAGPVALQLDSHRILVR